MRPRAARAAVSALLAACLTLIAGPLVRAAETADLSQLTRETQQQYQDESTLEIVWWVPAAIWAALLRGDSDPTQQRLDLFEDYLVFFVAEAELGALGGVTFHDAEYTRKRLRVLGAEGRRYAPLDADELPSDLQVLLNTLRPALASGAGKIGESFRPFVFRARDDQGKPFARAREPGQLRVALGERTFRWRLPLAALLPPKRCPVDGEELSGAFTYCPYHGNEL